MDRAARITGLAVLLLAAAVSVVVALLLAGGADRLPSGDAGAAVRLGLPIARLVVDLSAAVTIGGLALAVVGLPVGGRAWNRTLDVGAAASALWTVAAAVAAFCTFVSATDGSVTADARTGESLGVFVTGTDTGRAWLVTVLVAAVVTVLCFAFRSRGLVALTAGVAMVGLVPLAQQGHTAGTADHDAAVSALGLHLVGAALWVGGLVLLVLLRGVLASGELPAVVGRYSSIALGCFVFVAVSGVVSAQIRVGGWAGLGTGYGVLVLVKVAALLVLGVLGAVHRRRTVRQLRGAPERRAPFWRLVVVDLGVMGVASGASAALGQTAPPVDRIAPSRTADPSPAALLTDDRLPSAPGAWGWLTAWDVDLFWCMLVVLCVLAYAAGVLRLRRRGEPWPVRRSVAAALATATLLVATSGSLHLYDRVLVSANVGAHVLLGLVVPVLVCAAAPVDLVRRAVHPREDGSTGVREWTELLVRSAPVRVLTRPLPAAVLLAAVWWAFVGTQALRWSVGDATVRTVADAVFLVVGLLGASALSAPAASLDSRPRATELVERTIGGVLVAAGTVSLGIALLGPLGLVQASWFGAMGRTWGPTPLVDQARAGIVLVAAGVAFLALVVAVALLRARGAGGGVRDSATVEADVPRASRPAEPHATVEADVPRASRPAEPHATGRRESA